MDKEAYQEGCQIDAQIAKRLANFDKSDFDKYLVKDDIQSADEPDKDSEDSTPKE